MTLTQANASLLKDHCQLVDGVILSSYQCPKSKIKLPLATCEYINNYQEKLFFNGCSGPSGGYEKQFYVSCIEHDLCYHHEPATNGLTQKECDIKFYQKMLNACKSGVTNRKHCEKWAKRLYRAVRLIGGIAYRCSNQYANY